MKNLKKIGIQFTLFITVICCFGIITFSIAHDSLELTDLTEYHDTYGNSHSVGNHGHLHFDDFIHIVDVADSKNLEDMVHLYSIELYPPSQYKISVWQPPKLI